VVRFESDQATTTAELSGSAGGPLIIVDSWLSAVKAPRVKPEARFLVDEARLDQEGGGKPI
jgi:hypothetical protein